MAAPAPAAARYTVERYFRLVDDGLLERDDRVELLEGVVVSMSPQNPPHAATVSIVARTLGRLIGERGAVRTRLPFIAGPTSVPEPDVAVVPGREHEYATSHPTVALLVVEVGDTSLAQDRLTKAAIYAGAGVPQYLVVNVRDDCIEVFRSPDPAARTFADVQIARRGEHLRLDALGDVDVLVDELLPPSPPVA